MNPVIQASQYPVTASKWSHLIRNQMVQNRSDYKEVYVTIGLQQLSGPTKQVKPQIIGVHSDPEVSLPNQYPYESFNGCKINEMVAKITETCPNIGRVANLV